MPTCAHLLRGVKRQFGPTLLLAILGAGAVGLKMLWVDRGLPLQLSYAIDFRDVSSGELRVSGQVSSRTPVKALFSMVPATVAEHRDLVLETEFGEPGSVQRQVRGIGASDFFFYLPVRQQRRFTFQYRVRLGRRELTNAGSETGYIFGICSSSIVVFSGKYSLIVPADTPEDSKVEVRLVNLPPGFLVLPPFTGDAETGYLYSGKIGELTRTTVVAGLLKDEGGRIFLQASLPSSDRSQILGAFSLMGKAYPETLLDQVTFALLEETVDGYDVFTPDSNGLIAATASPATPRRMAKLMERIVSVQLAKKREASHSQWYFRGLEKWLGADFRHRYAAGNGLIEVGQDVYFEKTTAPAYQRSVTELGELDPERQPITIELLRARSRQMVEGIVAHLPAGESPARRLLQFALAAPSSDEALRPVLELASVSVMDLEREAMGRLPLDQGPPPKILGPSDGSSVVPRPAPASILWLLFTGGVEGYLENCGCSANQSGGLDKQIAFATRFRKDHPKSIILDLGRLLPIEEGPRLSPEVAVQGEIFARLAARMGFDALAVSSSEIYNLHDLREARYFDPDLYICQNLQHSGEGLFSAARLVKRTDPPVFLVSLFDPAASQGNRAIEDRLNRMQAPVDAEALERLISEKAPPGSLVILFGHISAVHAKLLLEKVPRIDLLLRASENAWEPLDDFPNLYDPRRYGHTLVLPANMRSYGLNVARLELGGDGGILDFDFQEIELDSSRTADPRTKEEISKLYEEAYREEPAAGHRENVASAYSGAEGCAPCHAQQYAQWKGTRHYKAYLTLVERRRNFVPECLGCHVTGYSDSSLSYAQLKIFGGVQCESCHGAGLGHIKTSGRSQLRAKISKEMCAVCHSPERSANFPGQFHEKYEAIRH